MTLLLPLNVAIVMEAYARRETPDRLRLPQTPYSRLVNETFEAAYYPGVADYDTRMKAQETQQLRRMARLQRLEQKRETRTLELDMTPTGVHTAIKTLSELLPEV